MIKIINIKNHTVMKCVSEQVVKDYLDTKEWELYREAQKKPEPEMKLKQDAAKVK